MLSLEQLQDLHREYMFDVASYSGFVHEHDASTRPLGVYHLIRLLEERGVHHLGEFGTGFSTIVLRTWAQAENRSIQFTTVEHDPTWCQFMAGLLTRRGLPSDNIIDLAVFKTATRMMGACPFDGVFIDHGPTMESRGEDIPWILSLVAPGGLIVFDDWFPSHVRAWRGTKRFARILSRMRMDWRPLEESRPNPDDKAICVMTQRG